LNHLLSLLALQLQVRSRPSKVSTVIPVSSFSSLPRRYFINTDPFLLSIPPPLPSSPVPAPVPQEEQNGMSSVFISRGVLDLRIQEMFQEYQIVKDLSLSHCSLTSPCPLPWLFEREGGKTRNGEKIHFRGLPDPRPPPPPLTVASHHPILCESRTTRHISL
jgi:hypothetical protein